jgi:hypothetical protein
MREQAGVKKRNQKHAPVITILRSQVADSKTRRIDVSVFLEWMLHSLRAPY